MSARRKRFACYFWFVGWDCFSLGLHICASMPNIELHVPFGFIRIGWSHFGGNVLNADAVRWRGHGYRCE